MMLSPSIIGAGIAGLVVPIATWIVLSTRKPKAPGVVQTYSKGAPLLLMLVAVGTIATGIHLIVSGPGENSVAVHWITVALAFIAGLAALVGIYFYGKYALVADEDSVAIYHPFRGTHVLTHQNIVDVEDFRLRGTKYFVVTYRDGNRARKIQIDPVRFDVTQFFDKRAANQRFTYSGTARLGTDTKKHGLVITPETTLFGNRFYPVTEGIGFIAAGVNELADSFETWRRTWDGGGEEGRFFHGDFEQLLASMEPLDRSQTAFVQTANPQWTAVFSNDSTAGQGSDGSVAAKRLRCDYVQASIGFASENPATGFGAKAGWLFYYTMPSFPYGVNMYVQVSDQGNHRVKWQFDHSAAFMPFEDLASYEKRRIVDRFSPQMVIDYCRAVGIDPYNEEFYSGPIFVVENSAAKKNVEPQSLSYAQAQDRVGAHRL
ncbi:hypothetical protein [Trueperella bialowiezensis]|uniref:Uncharacterized protein n=1 Tax=Trueperella bialowiezensis TaxID=312285 RepID=A0A3S4V708_9ACTO|nr:hypothetical protein [Trueperella bialowiezensis]VEI13428.1 Uncharacterised protein [Trueperella bialowiezensis]